MPRQRYANRIGIIVRHPSDYNSSDLKLLIDRHFLGNESGTLNYILTLGIPVGKQKTRGQFYEKELSPRLFYDPYNMMRIVSMAIY